MSQQYLYGCMCVCVYLYLSSTNTISTVCTVQCIALPPAYNTERNERVLLLLFCWYFDVLFGLQLVHLILCFWYIYSAWSIPIVSKLVERNSFYKYVFFSFCTERTYRIYTHIYIVFDCLLLTTQCMMMIIFRYSRVWQLAFEAISNSVLYVYTF